MDRRTFFKLAGTGAGALLAAPKMLDFQEVPEKPEIPPEKPGTKLIPGYLYNRDNKQIAALANCTFEFRRNPIKVESLYDSWVTYIPGLEEVQIYGDMLPLDSMLQVYSYTWKNEMYRIVLNMPDGICYLEAEGQLVHWTMESEIDSPEVYGFIFHPIGGTTINTLT